jgi:hypothetical protein
MNSSLFYFVSSLSLSIAFSYLVCYSLITGEAPSRGWTAKRQESPISYWINLIILLMFAGISFSLLGNGLYNLYMHGEFQWK